MPLELHLAETAAAPRSGENEAARTIAIELTLAIVAADAARAVYAVAGEARSPSDSPRAVWCSDAGKAASALLARLKAISDRGEGLVDAEATVRAAVPDAHVADFLARWLRTDIVIGMA